MPLVVKFWLENICLLYKFILLSLVWKKMVLRQYFFSNVTYRAFIKIVFLVPPTPTPPIMIYLCGHQTP